MSGAVLLEVAHQVHLEVMSSCRYGGETGGGDMLTAGASAASSGGQVTIVSGSGTTYK